MDGGVVLVGGDKAVGVAGAEVVGGHCGVSSGGRGAREGGRVEVVLDVDVDGDRDGDGDGDRLELCGDVD